MKLLGLALFSLATLCTAQVSNDPFGPSNDRKMEGEALKLQGLWICETEKKDVTIIQHFFQDKFQLSQIELSTGVITHHATGFFNSPPTGLALQERTVFVSKIQDFKSEYLTNRSNNNEIYAMRWQNEKWIEKKSKAGGRLLMQKEDFPIPAPTLGPYATPSTEVTELDGFWVQTLDKSERVIKMYDRGTFTVTYLNVSTKEISRHLIGLYAVTGGEVRERVLYATRGWRKLIGEDLAKKLSPIGDEFTQTGPNGGSETWQRMTDKPVSKLAKRR